GRARREDGADLVVGVGGDDGISLSGWFFEYLHAPVSLQLIKPGEIDVYDFGSAAEQWYFNAYPSAASALQANRLWTRTDEALGGALAYEYSTAGHLGAFPPPAM